MLRSRHPSPVLLVLPVAAALAVGLTACSIGSPGSSGGGSSAGKGAASGGPSASSAPAAPAGSVSSDGVCGILPISKVNSILGSSYANSEEVALPALTMADAAYCSYTPASGAGDFVIQMATSHPADAASTMNEAAGGRLVPQSGIGDSAMYTEFYPELVVVWGQTTIEVGQANSVPGAKKVTLAQLEKLATAVHDAG